jgi:hypothetical protein
LGVAAQRCFSLQPPLVWQGLVLALWGAVAFWLPRPRGEASWHRPRREAPEAPPGTRGDWRHDGALVGAAALSVGALQRLAGPPAGDYNAVLLVWVAATGLFSSPPPLPAGWPRRA